MERTGKDADWASILYEDMRSMVVVAGAAMISKDPIYAFDAVRQGILTLRRYFNSSEHIPADSVVDILVPYFSVDLEWINEDEDKDERSGHVATSEYIDVNNQSNIRNIGTTALIREDKWDAQKAMPSSPQVLSSDSLVSVKLRTLNFGDDLPDGSTASSETKCLKASEDFRPLPDVEQRQTSIGNGLEVVAHDCYIFAKATIRAGAYLAKQCIVSSSTAAASTSEYYATCFAPREDDAIREDWLAALALDFLSETLKFSVMQNFSQLWITGDLDGYTRRMLTLGYHAAWGGLMKRLGYLTEAAVFWPTEEVVMISVDHTRLYICLGLTMGLGVSALLVMAARRISETKTVRDTTVAALTMDLTEVAHSTRAYGLCSAADLSKEDFKLPRLRWKGDERSTCVRKVAFDDDQLGLIANRDDGHVYNRRIRQQYV